MIDTIINYCTIDFKFIERNIQECLKFSNNVIIPVSSHLFDGTPENNELLEKTYKLGEGHPNVSFIQYKWHDDQPARFFHNFSRWVGLQYSTADYVLMLDADEIVDGDMMKEYLEQNIHQSYDVIAFKSYWYFREPTLQSTTTELAASLWKRSICTPNLIFHDSERWSYRFTTLHAKEEETLKGKIICHHFSWVRSEADMIKKVKSWGHNIDTDWVSLVEEEFSRHFNGTDFVHHYRYITVPNQFNILEKT